MGFVKSLFSGPPKPRDISNNLLQGVNLNQVGQAYNQANSGLQQQQNFINALQGQNGVQNLADVFAQQQATSGQLQGIANGTGPNPALAQLNNTTGQNIASQAALMAGQRGSGANAGLLARQAAMQGGNLQQQAVGQGAALQAQQQIAAIQAMQQQQANMANVANSQTGNLANGLSAYNTAAQNEQGNLLSALGNFNNAQVGATGNFNNAREAAYNSSTSLGGGIIGGAGAAALGIFGPKKASGGMIPYAEGGPVNVPQSMVGKYLYGSGSLQNASSMPNLIDNSMLQQQPDLGSSLTSGFNNISKAFGPKKAQGGPISGEMLASQGQKVPGNASVSGDSLKNDTVPALLSPGEVVLPRHVMNSKDPAEMAKKFVAAILAKQGMKK